MVSNYHKIWGWVKKDAPTATSWGGDDQDGIAEMTIYKLAYRLGGCLLSNDVDTLFVTQRLDRVQAGGFQCREVTKYHSHRRRKQEGDDDNTCVEDEGHTQHSSKPD